MTALRNILVAALFIIVYGCSESTEPNAIRGEYALVSVDGVPLPAPAPSWGTGFQYTEGILSLGAGSVSATWFAEHTVEQMHVRAPGTFITEYFPGGTFTLSGSTITLVQPLTGSYPAMTWTGTVQGTGITITRAGQTWKYER